MHLLTYLLTYLLRRVPVAGEVGELRGEIDDVQRGRGGNGRSPGRLILSVGCVSPFSHVELTPQREEGTVVHFVNKKGCGCPGGGDRGRQRRRGRRRGEGGGGDRGRDQGRGRWLRAEFLMIFGRVLYRLRIISNATFVKEAMCFFAI